VGKGKVPKKKAVHKTKGGKGANSKKETYELIQRYSSQGKGTKKAKSWAKVELTGKEGEALKKSGVGGQKFFRKIKKEKVQKEKKGGRGTSRTFCKFEIQATRGWGEKSPGGGMLNGKNV